MDTTVWLKSFCGNRSEYDSLWSSRLTLNTDSPDLTDCFQKTILTLMPTGILILSSIYWIPYLYSLSTVHCWQRISILNGTKLIGGICIVILQCALTYFAATGQTIGNEQVFSADIFSPAIKCATFVMVTIITRCEFRKGLHTSGPLFVFWIVLLLCETVTCRSYILRTTIQDESSPAYIVFYVYFALVLVEFFCQLFSDHEALRNWYSSKKYQKLTDESKPLLYDYEDGPEFLRDKKPRPDLTAPFWFWSSFLWLTKDIFHGWRRKVVFEDLHNLRPDDKCENIIPRFLKQFYKPANKPESRSKTRENNSLFWALFWSCGYTLLYAILLQIVAVLFQMLVPQIFRSLLNYLQEDDPYDWKGLLLASSMLVCNVILTLTNNHSVYHTWQIGIKVKSVCNSIIYRKTLRLAGAAMKTTTVGEIVNLMAVDAQKLQDLCAWSIFLFQAPMVLVSSFVFIWITIGPSSLAGIVIVIIVVPANGFLLINKVRKIQKKQMVEKDKRVITTNEILSGMKILKLYAWEPSFRDTVGISRENELHCVKKINLLNVLSYICWFLLPSVVLFAVLGSYVMTSEDYYLSPDLAFVTMSYINLFNLMLSFFPQSILFTGQALVSYERIQNYLGLEELRSDLVVNDNSISGAISISKASMNWETNEKYILKDINLDVPHGQLVAVVGHVGAGKSSLLSAMLGEMNVCEGQIKKSGSFAYVPQVAWIQNATLRENIVFGRKIRHAKYDEVLEACALKPDLQILPAGDRTEIGEKGINVSGGQKQRISLARSVYQDESIYLLDDPLSAVDAHVGKHIFDKVIGPNGLLRHKTRVLVTHSVTFLPKVDVIVVLKDGRICEVGGYHELLKQNGDFADFLKTYLTEMEDDSSDEEIVAMQRQLSALSQENPMARITLSGTDSEMETSKSTKKKNKIVRRMSSVYNTSGEQDRSRKISVLESLKKDTLIGEETAQEGSVQLAVIWNYIKAGGLIYFNLTVWFHLIFTGAQVGTSLWLSEWTNDMPINGSIPFDQATMRLGGFGGFICFQALTIWIVLLASAIGTVVASRNLHNNLLDKILHAPMAFFDTTPLGRILNRFSRDLDVIDTNIPMYLRGWLFSLAPLLTTFIILTYTAPLLLTVFVPLLTFYYFVQKAYISFVRKVRRIDNMRKSPIFAHFDESIVGASSIRAYDRQEEFIEKCDRLIDEGQQPFSLLIVGKRWIGIATEMLGSTVVFFVAMFATLQRDSLSTGLAGVAITYALQTTTTVRGLIMCSAELETYMVSVERVDDHCNIESEAPWEDEKNKPQPEWPQEGAVEFHDYETRYRPGLDLVLKDFTCSIKPGEKVGIVGRTGAGKSSLALALFRIIEAAGGYISIDGIRISDLGLHSLRSKLTIIPQDPVVFSGSLRRNLDPFNRYIDDAIWRALELAHLKTFVDSLVGGLDYDCGEGGDALSVGQRQLLCLARAVLRKTRVLILDEATAAVDLETDTLIQNTIRTQFKDCTILTVAHRLNTVMDYDKIMVLDKGRISEFDTPSKLLESKFSIFHGLAKEAGLV